MVIAVGLLLCHCLSSVVHVKNWPEQFKIFSVSEVLSMVDLDYTQSGSDLDINDPYDESDSDISELDDDSVAMEEPPEEHVPIEEHMVSNEPVCHPTRKKRRRHPKPIAREWWEIPDMKNDKPPTLLDYGEIGGPRRTIMSHHLADNGFGVQQIPEKFNNKCYFDKCGVVMI